MKKPAVILFCSLTLLSSCLKEDQLKLDFKSMKPVTYSDGWPVSTPEAESIDSLALEAVYRDFHSNEDHWQVRSLLVFRNGKLVAESYTKDANDLTTPRAVWSCTKQVTGMLTGIALDKSLITSLDDKMSDYLPVVQNYPDKQNITLFNLLTMKSGIDFSNDGLSGQTSKLLRQIPDNSVEYILDLPMSSAPGEVFDYNDGNPHLMSGVLQAVSGKKTDEWAKEVLFDKLEIKNLKWERYRDGVTFGGFGIMTTPRELAKFGEVVLENGKWQGSYIVDSAYISMMTSIYEEKAFDRSFGLFWWIDKERDIKIMSGHGGQYVFIVPDKNLIVTITSEPNTQGEFQFGDAAFDYLDRIIATCRE